MYAFIETSKDEIYSGDVIEGFIIFEIFNDKVSHYVKEVILDLKGQIIQTHDKSRNLFPYHKPKKGKKHLLYQ